MLATPPYNDRIDECDGSLNIDDNNPLCASQLRRGNSPAEASFGSECMERIKKITNEPADVVAAYDRGALHPERWIAQLQDFTPGHRIALS